MYRTRLRALAARAARFVVLLPALAVSTACGGATVAPEAPSPFLCPPEPCKALAPASIAECACDDSGMLVTRTTVHEDGTVCRESYAPEGELRVGIMECDFGGDGVVDERERRWVRDGEMVAMEGDWDNDGTWDDRTEWESSELAGYVTVSMRSDYELDGVWDACDLATYRGREMVSSTIDYDCDGYSDESYDYVDCWPPYLDCEVVAPGMRPPADADIVRELAVSAVRLDFGDVALDPGEYDLGAWVAPMFGDECAEPPAPPELDGEVVRSCDTEGRALVVLAFDSLLWTHTYTRFVYDERGRVAYVTLDDAYGPIWSAEALYDQEGRLAGVVRYGSGSGFGTTIERYDYDWDYRVGATYDYGADGTIDTDCAVECGRADLLGDCLVLSCDHDGDGNPDWVPDQYFGPPGGPPDPALEGWDE